MYNTLRGKKVSIIKASSSFLLYIPLVAITSNEMTEIGYVNSVRWIPAIHAIMKEEWTKIERLNSWI